MKKVTFATLKKLSKTHLLYHQVMAEHLPYGMKWYKEDVIPGETKLTDLEKFKMTKNWIGKSEDNEGTKCITLSNCCYVINFYHPSFTKGVK